MRAYTFRLARIAVLAAAAAAGACSPAAPPPPAADPAPPPPSPPPAPREPAAGAEARSTEAARQPIRRVDFSNFTFPWPREQVRYVRERSFTLADGARPGQLGSKGEPRVWSAFLNSTRYADLTGDGREEAITSLYLLPNNEATVYGTYVYTIRDGRPRLLWSMLAKDRGVGGLRRIAPEDGQIVVELLGGDQEPPGAVPPDFDAPSIQPDEYTRLCYRWQRDRFELVAKETRPNPARNAGHAGG